VITKKADGSFNFSDITRPKEEAAGEKKERSLAYRST